MNPIRRSHLMLLAAVALVAAVAACATTGVTPSPLGAAADDGNTTVPILTGLGVTQTTKLLGDASLAGQPHYIVDANVQPGVVLRSTPAAGARVPFGTLVLYEIAEAAAPAAMTLGELATRYPEAFVGSFVDTDRVTVVSFNPGVDTETWRAKLTAAAAGAPYRVRACPRSWADLARIQVLLARRDWTARAPYPQFATAIDPSSCSVRLSSAGLNDEEKQTITARFGAAVTIVPDSAAGRG